jgi:hypothetical protein
MKYFSSAEIDANRVGSRIDRVIRIIDATITDM